MTLTSIKLYCSSDCGSSKALLTVLQETHRNQVSMAGDNSEVLDVAKENIQPLRHGRKAAQLKTALQAQADPDVYQLLMKQRE